MKIPPPAPLKQCLVYPARMTIAAVLALLAAWLLGLQESYWAAISALIIVQSDFGASLLISWHRLIGTAVGVSVGALLAETVGRSVLVFGCGVLVAGLLASLLRLERPAIRFAAVAFSIVLLVPRAEPAWVVALHRFIEVAMGIVAGLLVAAVWPESPAEAARIEKVTQSRS
jgi:uncharacterized membrane protein YgaE (UPF0421/DUF939 family)